jgi:hypothetical protein
MLNYPIMKENVGRSFVESLSSDMSKDDFMKAVKDIVVDEDRNVLGENCEEQIANAILYPAVFAPFPATFDSNAIAGIIDEVGASDLQKTQDPTLDLEHTDKIINRTSLLLNRSIQLGVIEPDENGRFFIKPDVAKKLGTILEKFDE